MVLFKRKYNTSYRITIAGITMLRIHCRVPENLSLEEGALIEPWVVGLYAVERSAITVGQTCVIIGAGAIGIMVYLAAKLCGVLKICIVGEKSL